jgi:hypothetical protein
MEQEELDGYDETVEMDENETWDSPEYEEEQRSLSAPPGPLSEIEEFKRSKEFKVLEQAVFCCHHIIPKSYKKFDLESEEDLSIFRRFLKNLERLCELFKVPTHPRDYRNNFSNAYKILYEENCLCYLTEILDSAQESYPHLWVNGEKYLFSKEVLDGGERLVNEFFSVQHVLRNSYTKICHENFCTLDTIKQDIVSTLEVFDHIWTKYERTYIEELMAIENQARRFIIRAIEIEKCLTSIEIWEKVKGKIFVINEEYSLNRKKLCKIISKINSVANVEGKGRDDLDYEILEEAESILRRVTKQQSNAVRILAEKIRQSFSKIRQLLRKYEMGLESVDPQLRNNRDLVDSLMEYESSWEKGKNYFLDPAKCKYLIHFSHIIETTSEKLREFKEQVETRDADIFVSIPSLLVLRNLDNEDKNIVNFFLPQLSDPSTSLSELYGELQELFGTFKQTYARDYQYYNIIEKELIGIDLLPEEKKAASEFAGFVGMVNKVKRLAMELNRSSPLEWNSLLDASMEVLEYE